MMFMFFAKMMAILLTLFAALVSFWLFSPLWRSFAYSSFGRALMVRFGVLLLASRGVHFNFNLIFMFQNMADFEAIEEFVFTIPYFCDYSSN